MPIETEKLKALKQRMSEIRWYHRIDLPELGVTPGGSEHDQIRLDYMHLPANFDGGMVIDIGSWDGFFAVEAWRRGAEVIATDIWGDFNTPIPNNGDGIRFVLDVLNPRIRLLTTSVYELAGNIWLHDPETMADCVIFPGVLYHLNNPLAALEEIYKILVPGGLLILETHLDLTGIDRPAMALYPHGWANDMTNYIGPNPQAVECLLKWAGFRSMQFVGGINLAGFPRIGAGDLARGAWHARK